MFEEMLHVVVNYDDWEVQCVVVRKNRIFKGLKKRPGRMDRVFNEKKSVLLFDYFNHWCLVIALDANEVESIAIITKINLRVTSTGLSFAYQLSCSVHNAVVGIIRSADNKWTVVWIGVDSEFWKFIHGNARASCYVLSDNNSSRFATLLWVTIHCINRCCGWGDNDITNGRHLWAVCIGPVVSTSPCCEKCCRFTSADGWRVGRSIDNRKSVYNNGGHDAGEVFTPFSWNTGDGVLWGDGWCNFFFMLFLGMRL